MSFVVTTYTCLACAYQGPEVQMTVVELPPEEQRIVNQGYPVSWDVRGRVIGMEYRDVVQRYVWEPRCRDYNPPPGQPSKCRDRIRAAEQAMQASPRTPADAEEGPPWSTPR